ncbi:MAG: dethiobiotin synthase [Piscirickettsiaceae bacterium]|nr:MAG: dethiobiotin synthase [Piscirickettsiaceae bacterium]
MTIGFFVTGTDTGVGKTFVSCQLMHAIKNHGRSVVGFKPVASGAKVESGSIKNEDALQLQQASSIRVSYDLINPYCFAEAIAPHIAAERSNTNIELSKIKSCYQQLANKADVVIVEGAGGWLTPLTVTTGFDSIAESLNLQVILVVAVRLGCINHALLTEQAIKAAGRTLVGWVANCIDSDFQNIDETISTLEQKVSATYLGKINYQQQGCAQKFNNYINISSILD